MCRAVRERKEVLPFPWEEMNRKPNEVVTVEEELGTEQWEH